MSLDRRTHHIGTIGRVPSVAPGRDRSGPEQPVLHASAEDHQGFRVRAYGGSCALTFDQPQRRPRGRVPPDLYLAREMHIATGLALDWIIHIAQY